MTVKAFSTGLKGLKGYRVQVEVRIKPGTESRERVATAMGHFDADITDQKVVVNLSPSEQKKNGPLFDLAIAVAALKELNMIKIDIPSDAAFIGALSLDYIMPEENVTRTAVRVLLIMRIIVIYFTKKTLMNMSNGRNEYKAREYLVSSLLIPGFPL